MFSYAGGWRFPSMLILILMGSSITSAAEPSLPLGALTKVPASAESYGASLRLAESIELIGKTRAWNLIWNHPLIQAQRQQVLAEAKEKGSAWTPILEFFQQRENQPLPALLADALGQEVVIYFGSGSADFLSLIQEVIGSLQYGPRLAKVLGDSEAGELRSRIRFVLATLAENPNRLTLPSMVLALKLSKPEQVAQQLRRLDPVLEAALKETALAGRSRRVTIAGDSFLTLTIDGSLLPKEVLDLRPYEDHKGEFAELAKLLPKLTASVAFGVRDGYLLFSVGRSPEHLAEFGGPGPKLATVPEIQKLARYAEAGQPVIGLTYTSSKWLGKIGLTSDDLSGLVELFKMILVNAELPDDLEGKIEADIEAFLKSMARHVVVPGAYTSITLRTPTGWETFSHDHTLVTTPAQKPLTILNHVGGHPLLFVAGRSRTTVADYQEMARWLGIFGGHLESVIALKSPNAEEALTIYRQDVKPLLQRLGTIIETLLLPALADGQMAVVVDAKWSSEKWHAALPPLGRALPLPELGLVLGVSDAEKFAEAFKQFRLLINRVYATMQKHDKDGELKDWELPRPQIEKAGTNRYAFYPVPEQLGLDRQFQPTAGLSPSLAVLTLSRQHTNRLLKSTPLAVSDRPFANRSRMLESALHFNWAGWMGMLTPWSEVAEALAGGGNPEVVATLANQVRSLLGVFRSYSSVTYHEGGITVTHSETVLQDIPASIK